MRRAELLAFSLLASVPVFAQAPVRSPSTFDAKQFRVGPLAPAFAELSTWAPRGRAPSEPASQGLAPAAGAAARRGVLATSWTQAGVPWALTEMALAAPELESSEASRVAEGEAPSEPASFALVDPPVTFADASHGVESSGAEAWSAPAPVRDESAPEPSTGLASRSASLLPRVALAATESEPLVTPAPAPSRTVRLLGEGAAAATAGLVLPFALYGGFTSLSSFVGFFAGFLSASVAGLVLAPIAVMVTGGLLGARGGAGRGVLGALLGLVAAVVIGLPLATLPGAGYLVGLGLFWLLPSVGTLIAFEWGREQTPPPSGLTVLTF